MADPKVKAAFKRHMAKTAIPIRKSHSAHACYQLEHTFTENPRGWGCVSLYVDLYNYNAGPRFWVLGSEGPLGTRGSCDGPQSIEKVYYEKAIELSADPKEAMAQLRDQLPAILAEAQAAYDAAYEVFMKWEGKGK